MECVHSRTTLTRHKKTAVSVSWLKQTAPSLTSGEGEQFEGEMLQSLVLLYELGRGTCPKESVSQPGLHVVKETSRTTRQLTPTVTLRRARALRLPPSAQTRPRPLTPPRQLNRAGLKL